MDHVEPNGTGDVTQASAPEQTTGATAGLVAVDTSQDSEEILEGDSDDEAELELESTLMDLIEEVEKAIDRGGAPESGVPFVTVPIEVSKEVMHTLVSKGTLAFLGKYLLQAEDGNSSMRPYTVPQLLAALGFPLPLDVVNDERFQDHHFEVALQLAIRYTLSHRRRLDKPRSLEEVVESIQNAKNIIVVTGAGISTSLGIPDFRSENGLYAQLEHLGLNDPQEVFDIRTFRDDPSVFYSVAAKILPEKGLHTATPTHKFLKLLQEKKKLLRNYTQNIDNLEQYVGIPSELIVQCHGSFGSAHCFTCGYSVPDGETLFPEIRRGEVPRCPHCEKRRAQGKRKHKGSDDEDEGDNDASYGVLKPDITFFGESLPPRFDRMLFDEGDAENCDLMLCIGTSLRVSPVSEIVKVVPRQVPQIYISKTPAKHLTFEVSFLGGCDDVIELLCQKLGWDLDHPMNRRPKDMQSDRYPGGTIEDSNGTFRFTPDSQPSEAVTKELENESSRVENELN